MRKISAVPIIVALAVALVSLAAGGVWFYRSEAADFRTRAVNELSSIARLKAAQITNWRSERLADAGVLSETESLAAAGHIVQAGLDNGHREQMLARFRSLAKHYHYSDVLLVDPDGRVRLSLGDHIESRDDYGAALAEAFRRNAPVFTDLHAGPHLPVPHLSVVSPLFAGKGAKRRPVGAVILVSDTARFLRPLVQEWPYPSRSAETLLVARDRDSVLFLNDLRHRKDTALKLRIPLGSEESMEAMAVTGTQGEADGRDYRGIPVIGFIQPVPQSSWFLIAKIDEAEFFASWRYRSLLLAALYLTLTGLLAAVGFAVWQRSRTAHYQALYGAEALLKEKTEEIERYFTTALDLFCIADTDGHFLRLNSQWQETLGYPLDHLEGRRFLDFVHPDDREATREKVSLLAGQEQVIGFVNRYRCSDGGYRWIEWRSKPKGRFVYAAARDITDRKRVEDALRRSEIVLSRCRDAIIQVARADGRILAVNASAMAVYGYSGEEMTSLAIRDLRAEETAALTAEQIEKADRDGILFETVHRRRDGATFPVEVSSQGVTIDGERVLISVIRDISDRKQAEERLIASNRELAAANARARELALQAELANRAKSEFLANMSHEIRTPMNGIIGMTGLLLESELSPEQRQYAEVVRSSGDSLLLLLNDILDFSKIEAGKLEIAAIDFDLRAAVEDTAELLTVKAQEKGLELVCLIDPGIPALLRGDPGRLRQILVNLGGNAIKFTHRGEIIIHVVLESEQEDRVTVRCSVIDTGIGIPPDKRADLFTPFTQVDGSITRRYGGTGLGLAISRQLAEMMGGSIGFSSEEEKGSTFWFTATFVKQAADGAKDAPAAADVAGVRVLVVDEHAANRRLVKTLLNAWGCRSGEAESGEQALGTLLEAVRCGEPYDVALLDMHVTNSDGAELGRIIKKCREIRDTRLVMLTSLGERGDAARLADMGFAGYLTKPLRQNMLRECLSLVMGRKNEPDANGVSCLVTRHTVSEISGRPARILLVEDNPTNQIVAVKILRKLGYHADVAANGREAVSALQRGCYNLVLMDCQMPEMDGFEATRRIRGSASADINGRIPIIAMTAYAMKGDRERCLEAGMDDYLSKPIRVDELAAVLERWLSRQGSECRESPSFSGAAEQPVGCSGEDDAMPPVFDRDAFLERVMGDEELAREIGATFLADMPAQMERLATALADGDVEQVKFLAHAIKGAAANVGGEALREAAWGIERTALDEKPEVLSGRVSDLEMRFFRLRDAFKSVVSTSENSE